VRIYREYRTGELPDVQVPYSSLVAPLSAVAAEDAETAVTVVCEFYAGVARASDRPISGMTGFCAVLGFVWFALLCSTFPLAKV
jgi:hypothetical protein